VILYGHRILVVMRAVIVVAGLTALPARVGARRPVSEIRRSELI
jgi:hypothetical protein